MLLTVEQVREWDQIAWAFGEIDAEPEPEVIAFLDSVHIGSASIGLDVGCGCGRHAIEAARRGHRVTAVDWSGVACAETRRRAERHGVSLEVRCESMEMLPFPDGAFDFAISWCVMNHGTKRTFERALAEAFRVLRAGGVLFGLVMTAEDDRYGQGLEVEEDCYAFTAGLEKGIIHYFTDREETVALLSRYGSVDELRDLTFSPSEIAAYHPSTERSCHIMFRVRKHSPHRKTDER